MKESQKDLAWGSSIGVSGGAGKDRGRSANKTACRVVTTQAACNHSKIEGVGDDNDVDDDVYDDNDIDDDGVGMVSVGAGLSTLNEAEASG